MKTELYHYRIHPLVVPLNTSKRMEIQPLETQYAFSEKATYSVKVCSLTRTLRGGFAPQDNEVAATVENGNLFFDYTFDAEEECYIRVFKKGWKDCIVQLSVYALADDLFALRPLKGDFHVHTCGSDGRETSPVAAANYREQGFDFTVISDHHNYAPSVEAQEAYQEIPLGMRIVNGEEVHTPNNYVHVIHFGGTASVNALFEDDTEEYEKEVAEIIAETKDIPYEDAFTWAANIWAVRRIHAVGGLAVFCHPFWISDVHNVPNELSRVFLMGEDFDAFELIGGQSAHENNLQVALYNDLRALGCTMPVLGASDSHGTINRGLFNKMFTVVFAEENEVQSIIAAVKKGLTAPVEVYEDSVNYSVHGSFRHVAYTRFLMEHYFAPQALLCREEGILMRLYLLGDKAAGERLTAIAGRTDEYYRRSFGLA